MIASLSLFPDEHELLMVRASHTQGHRAVGGKLYVTNLRLVFVAHGIDRATGGHKWECPRESVTVGGIDLGTALLIASSGEVSVTALLRRPAGLWLANALPTTLTNSRTYPGGNRPFAQEEKVTFPADGVASLANFPPLQLFGNSRYVRASGNQFGFRRLPEELKSDGSTDFARRNGVYIGNPNCFVIEPATATATPSRSLVSLLLTDSFKISFSCVSPVLPP